MNSERTFQREPIVLTIRHLVIILTIASFLIGMLDIVFIAGGDWILLVTQIFMLAYLKLGRKATANATVIAVMTMAAANGFFIAVDTAQKFVATGTMSHFSMWGSCVLTVFAIIFVYAVVDELPNKWDTLIRHVYPD